MAKTDANPPMPQFSVDYSLVEVPEVLADRIMAALGKATIRGKQVQARRYRE